MKSNDKATIPELPVYPSMAACAGATGIPLAVLKRAKREGCKAFHASGRVILADLLPFLFSGGGGEADKIDIEFENARRMRAEATKSEIEARIAARTVIKREDVQKFMGSSFGAIREQIIALPARLASVVNPADPQHAKSVLTQWGDGILTMLREEIPDELQPDE